MIILLSSALLIFSPTFRGLLEQVFAAGALLISDQALLWPLCATTLAVAALLQVLVSHSRGPAPVQHDDDAKPLAVKDDPDHYIWRLADSSTITTANGKGRLLGTLLGRQVWETVPTDAQTALDQRTRPGMSFDREANPNSADRMLRAPHEGVAEPEPEVAATSADAALHGAAFFAKLQRPGGFWAGDYGGPLFLLPGFVISLYVTRTLTSTLDRAHREGMLTYLLNHQQADGGWGTHIEGSSTMFGTTLNYVAARLLGLPATSGAAARARLFVHTHGGALTAPSWAKTWLAILGAMDWEGVNPVPPELWLLPNWFPFHPGRLWCHCRMYLPMSYLYGARFTHCDASCRTRTDTARGAQNGGGGGIGRNDCFEGPVDQLVLALRGELYVTKYEDINWSATRDIIAPMDSYSPTTKMMKGLNALLYYTLESPKFRSKWFGLGFALGPLRRAALRFCGAYIMAEDEQTNWVDIGPVNKALNLVAQWHYSGADSEAFALHLPRVADYLWVAEDGIKCQGYNGSQLWDTAFAAQAMHYALEAATASKLVGSGVSDGETDIVAASLDRAHAYVDGSQVREDVTERERFFRHISKGGWPFSTNDHGWPITDCTAEGLKVCLLLMGGEAAKYGDNTALPRISKGRLEDAVKVVLSMHNAAKATGGDGGWASYELNRGWNWYELLNPAEVFGDIMIDYSYVECTSACVQSLAAFAQAYPDHASVSNIKRAVAEGVAFVSSKQRPDGSFYGSWAVCFTYGGWFAVDAIAAGIELGVADVGELSKRVIAAVRFLLTKQNDDGGWGESVASCARKEYVPHERGSQVVNTAWVLLALARCAEAVPPSLWEKLDLTRVAAEAERFLRGRQLRSGDWAQEGVSGVFNKSCAISYSNYRNIFPIWALARHAIVFEQSA